MHSLFSKKARSQASTGPAGELPLGSAPPPSSLPGDLLFQQQQQQQQQHQLYSAQFPQGDYTARTFNQTRRPSEPFLLSPLQSRFQQNPYPPGIGSQPGRDLSLDELRQQQQQQQLNQYRHPRRVDNVSQSSINYPPIGLVERQQQQIPSEPPSYQSSPDPDGNPGEQSWANPSFQDLQDKAQRKKGFFSRNQTVILGSPGKLTKRDKSLGRSASIKHTFGSGSLQLLQPLTRRDQQPEYERVAGGPLNKSQPDLVHPNNSDSGVALPPAKETLDIFSKSHGLSQPLSQPLSPLETQTFQHLDIDSNDRSNHLLGHSRSASAESIPSQASSRRPSVQHPSLDQSLGDMAATTDRQQQQGSARPSDSQPQISIRKDSLAAASGQTNIQNATQGGSSFKGNSSQQNLQDTQAQGRETPPSAQPNSKLREELEGLDIAALVSRHEELHAKYQKVKRYYFEKEAQVTQLQNTVAHQRMAVSRTVLDDNEYTSRFNRLDGAIKELAFSIRKDWKTIPDWLHPFVNEDAVTVGTKEMTAVGRAVISRWIVEDVFNHYFHPGLERTFSEQLKNIEVNLRHQQTQVFNEDDKENQVARISNWRRTTLDGLGDELQSKITQENQAQLVEHLIEKLSLTLQCDLKEPSPPEIAHYTQMIVENTINILEKIPQESRDIIVDYVPPGIPIAETTMKVETGLPPLARTLAESKENGSSERDSTEEMEIDNNNNKEGNNSPQQDEDGNAKKLGYIPQNRDQRKKYPFGSLISKKSLVPSSSSSVNNNNTTQSGGASPSSADTATNKEREEQQLLLQQSGKRVRLAVFMTVEVRGRGPNNVLIQAPVYTIES